MSDRRGYVNPQDVPDAAPTPPRVRPWIRRNGRRLLLVATVLVVVAAAALVVAVLLTPAPPAVPPTEVRAQPPGDQCAPNVVRRGPARECVGHTEGSYTFAPELGLADALGTIKEENDRVFAGGRTTVSVAYVASLPTVPLSPGDAAGLESVKKELYGIAVAQRRANRTATLGDTPQVRVLVANVGAGGRLWSDVVPALAGQASRPNRLVAVLGLAAEPQPENAMLADIARRGIPMYPTPAAEGSLTARPAGVFSVGSSAAAQGADAAGYLTQLGGRVLVVEDRAGVDALPAGLRDGLTKGLGNGVTTVEPELFGSGAGGVGNAFFRMTPAVCDKAADTVFFAGHGRDLPAFLEAMAGRQCLDRPLRVVTGAQGAAVVQELRNEVRGPQQDIAQALRNGNLRFQYTGLVHPDQWKPPSVVTTPLTDTCPDTCLLGLFPGAANDDGVTAMAYDAALMPIYSLRNAPASQSAEPSPYTYVPGTVTELSKQITPASPVLGASGAIAFDPRGAVVDKPDPVVELQPDGRVTFVRTVP